MKEYNILYVDDEVSNLQGFESIYFTDYHIYTAISGNAALEILRKQLIHVIITDQKMPGMTGVEFLNKVVIKYPDPIRIILTGYSDIEVIIKAINSCGIYRYLTKPWDLQEMNMVLDQAIETYSLRKQNKKLVDDLQKVNEDLELKVRERTLEVERQKANIEEKNDKITASINYAKRIQEAMLPKIEDIKEHLNDVFVFFKPRNIVSGDFYWFHEYYGKIIIAAVDCTGHGVPGAFMSMVGTQALNNIVSIKHYYKPDLILNELRKEVRILLQQDSSKNKDGMDVSLCMIDHDREIINFAGAKNTLVYIENGEVVQCKGDRHSIGGSLDTKKEAIFRNHQVALKSNTTYYLFTDGYQDQFGGAEDKKFMIKRLKELFLDIYTLPMAEQQQVLENTLSEWMQGRSQVDDILVLGFRV